AALVRTRYELERKYEADAKQKITSLLAIPGLRVETAFELDNLFRLHGRSASIMVPMSYCRRRQDCRPPDRRVADPDLTIEVEVIKEIECAVINILPSPAKDAEYCRIRVIVVD